MADSAANSPGNISKTTSDNTTIAFLVLATVSFIARCIARWRLVPEIQLEDGLLSFAFICFVAMAITVFETEIWSEKLGNDISPEGEPTPDFFSDYSTAVKLGFAAQIMFYATLWSVKFSLLWMFRRLTAGLPAYDRAWIAIMVFTFATFVGGFVSHFVVCDNMTDWFAYGKCGISARDQVAAKVEVYYAFAVDVITDILIMIIPISLVFSLHIEIADKITICLVFGVGTISVLFAIVRVVSLGSHEDDGQFNQSWLSLWATIEAGTVIIVGCLPALGIFIRREFKQSKSEHIPTSEESFRNNKKSRNESVQLRDVDSARSHPQNPDW